MLVIDDEKVVREMLQHNFTSLGWDVLLARNGAEGVRSADDFTPDVILLDMRMPDMDGMEALRTLKQRGCSASVIIMTGWGTISNAVDAVKLGAEQYLTKPINLVELGALVAGIIEKRKLRLENIYYQQRMDHPVVGASMAVQKLHHMIDLMAENSDTTVLLLGESGTGKELVAREIHRRSIRRERPFLDINCAGLSETLIESEMFGHERGAFTDAREMKRGLLEVADGGTVFLDEIGEMPLAVQPKLLRVLETRTFKRVGGTRDIKVNVRIIAATNSDLARTVAEGRFREDLYYRLKVFPLLIPPLRERPDDVPVLAGYFITQYNLTLRKNINGFSSEAMELMKIYAWPGNVRELKNVVERAVVLSKDDMIEVDLLPREIAGVDQAPHSQKIGAERIPNKKRLEDVEREHVLAVLRAEQQNRTVTAKVLGISRSTLIEKLKKYGIK